MAQAMVGVDGAAQAVVDSLIYLSTYQEFIMKSSSVFFMAVVTTLALGSTAYAKGPAGGAQGAGTGAATGTASRSNLQTHTPGTGLTNPSLTTTTRPATAGTRNGIHTPGTGLATTN